MCMNLVGRWTQWNSAPLFVHPHIGEAIFKWVDNVDYLIDFSFFFFGFILYPISSSKSSQLKILLEP